jgi:hypothetical protein
MHWYFVFVSFLVLVSSIAKADVINFEDKSLVENSFYNGNANLNGWSSGGVQFSNSYDATFDAWSGFSYSNVVNTTTAGFGNQYAAFPGSGSASAQYAVAFNFFQGDAVVSFATPVIVNSADFANTTYAGLSMQDGDGFAKKFGGVTGDDLDFFKLDVVGSLLGTTTGTVSIYLADFRFSDNSLDYILRTWKTENLSSLGTVDSLQFDLTSSDNGAFGINTPTYFALDNINITAVPEPSTLLLFASVSTGLGAIRYRRNRTRSVSPGATNPR